MCKEQSSRFFVEYCFQVGNFLIHVSREREKNPQVVGKQIKGCIHIVGSGIIEASYLTKEIMQEATEASANC